jgi:hypothetical protein
MSEHRTIEEGRLKPPYGLPLLGAHASSQQAARCRNDECQGILNEEDGAYLHKNRETGYFIIFCGSCSLQAQLWDSLRFPLIPL